MAMSKRLPNSISKNLDAFEKKMRFYEFIDKIKKYTGLTFLKYDVYRPLRRLLKWVPVIWKDRDYDHSYMFSLLKYKLERMSYCLRSHDGVDDFEKDILDPAMHPMEREQIKKQLEYYYGLMRCIQLCERVTTCDYHKEYDEMFIKHYGAVIELKDEHIPLANGNFQWKIHHVLDALPVEKRKIADAVYKRYGPCHYEDHHRQKDIDELFSLMAKYCQGWWS